jgi:hypothetical protein
MAQATLGQAVATVCAEFTGGRVVHNARAAHVGPGCFIQLRGFLLND